MPEKCQKNARKMPEKCPPNTGKNIYKFLNF
jgi:hypothetical protein